MQGTPVCPHTLLLALALLTQGVHSIKITKVKVPRMLEAGGAADLDCEWKEDSDQMYSVKWYQGAHEFYRYTPSGRDPVQVFEIPTLDVERERSWGGSVRIANVTIGAEGPFHCEVSADGPTFHTASDSAEMKVVDLPDGGPMVKGVKTMYKVGDWVDLRCVSRRSRPPATLSFTLNSKPVHIGWMEPQNNYNDTEGLTISSRQLHFTLLPDMLRHGEARVRCAAQIPGTLYHQTSDGVLTILSPYHASVRDAAGRVSDPPYHVVLAALQMMMMMVMSRL